jgi:hypothetical protein
MGKVQSMDATAGLSVVCMFVHCYVFCHILFVFQSEKSPQFLWSWNHEYLQQKQTCMIKFIELVNLRDGLT